MIYLNIFDDGHSGSTPNAFTSLRAAASQLVDEDAMAIRADHCKTVILREVGDHVEQEDVTQRCGMLALQILREIESEASADAEHRHSFSVPSSISAW